MTQESTIVLLGNQTPAQAYEVGGVVTPAGGLDEWIVYKLENIPSRGPDRDGLLFSLNNPFPILISTLWIERGWNGTCEYWVYDNNNEELYSGVLSQSIHLPVGAPIPANSTIKLKASESITKGRLQCRRIALAVSFLGGTSS
jgi:hypothetical protein